MAELEDSNWARRMPQGAPTEAAKSAENVNVFNHRRFKEGLSKVEDKMARPSVDMSLAEEYMLLLLKTFSFTLRRLHDHTHRLASRRTTHQKSFVVVVGMMPTEIGAF